MKGKRLLHSICRQPVSITALANDVALYVYCYMCMDIVEEGELLREAAPELGPIAIDELVTVRVVEEIT